MGEAKQRGSFEDRLAAALVRPGGRKMPLSNLKDCTHYAIVIDHSDEGKAARDLTRRTFAEFEPIWMKFDSGYQFLILVKGKNQTDQGTMLSADLETLKHDGIPAVVQKVASVGGRLGFILAVAPALVEELSMVVSGQSYSAAH